MTLTTEQLNSSNEKMCGGDSVETIEKNPKSWAAWKREAERLQAIIDDAANREAQPVALDVIARFKEWNTGFPVEKFKADYVIGWVLANYYAPPAPSVPSELLDAMEGVIRISDRDHEAWARAKAAITACRAAILAQPVSSGYKLVPAEATEDMIAAAMNCDDVSFNADETFCVNFGNIYAAMLAAAPEGGSDHDTRR
ncbi:hypothetical protein ABH11_01516 [Serratia marcescens]|uniref:hypothetical protein n=1 Tax=Serratia marcescens TaxID=615 RepID=UPI0006CB2DA2|nr:hypothetical protein [Serratia marcescens]ALE95860.1 hypothetical protein ABH11_01516 [Serratia marcescens]